MNGLWSRKNMRAIFVRTYMTVEYDGGKDEHDRVMSRATQTILERINKPLSRKLERESVQEI